MLIKICTFYGVNVHIVHQLLLHLQRTNFMYMFIWKKAPVVPKSCQWWIHEPNLKLWKHLVWTRVLYLGLFLCQLNFESCFDILMSGAGMYIWRAEKTKTVQPFFPGDVGLIKVVWVPKILRPLPLFPNGSPLGDPGPLGDLFGDLGPLFMFWVPFFSILD